ncbi:hypothetical protein [Nocardia niwae]|uniref:hypothetical protein n=1 Tax=Nocardia niwae TaxID=626084 RepID=UPI0033D97096
MKEMPDDQALRAGGKPFERCRNLLAEKTVSYTVGETIPLMPIPLHHDSSPFSITP